MLMKIQNHGGTTAMLQTALSLQQFTRHLSISSGPVPGQTTSLLHYDYRSSLFVDQKGQLQIINTDYQNN
jgi:hypothetical protein